MVMVLADLSTGLYRAHFKGGGSGSRLLIAYTLGYMLLLVSFSIGSVAPSNNMSALSLRER